MKLQEAEGELASAEAEDTRELIKAVSAESPGPGTPLTNKARRALEYAGERLLQKYTALGVAQEAMTKQAQAEPGDVVQQAVRIERDLLGRLESAHAEATALVDKANAEFSTFGDAINGIEALGVETAEGIIFGYSLSAPGFTMPPYIVASTTQRSRGSTTSTEPTWYAASRSTDPLKGVGRDPRRPHPLVPPGEVCKTRVGFKSLRRDGSHRHVGGGLPEVEGTDFAEN